MMAIRAVAFDTVGVLLRDNTQAVAASEALLHSSDA